MCAGEGVAHSYGADSADAWGAFGLWDSDFRRGEGFLPNGDVESGGRAIWLSISANWEMGNGLLISAMSGQGYELNVPLSDEYVGRFHELHRQRYGYADAKRAIEVVNVRVRRTARDCACGGTMCGAQTGRWDAGDYPEQADLLRRRLARGQGLCAGSIAAGRCVCRACGDCGIQRYDVCGAGSRSEGGGYSNLVISV